MRATALAGSTRRGLVHRITDGAGMDRGEDAREGELSNLRLALATFALHLDAFEMRAGDAALAALAAAKNQGENHGSSQGKAQGKHDRGMRDWASIRSPGSKSDT